MSIGSHASLKTFHTFGIDVKAKAIVEAHNISDFKAIWTQYPNETKLLLGEGSNLLFCCDFDGVVVRNCLKGIQVEETKTDYLLEVNGGENWHKLVSWTLSQKMYGLENLALIPGLVGSAPIQNIGAYGVEFADFCQYVDVLMIDTWQTKRLTFKECEFGYRESIFKQALKDKAIITAVGLKLSKTWQPSLDYAPLNQLKNNPDLTPLTVFEAVCQIRKEKLPEPRLLGNAGSFFKNPIVEKALADKLKMQFPTLPCYDYSDTQVKVAAGWLIDKAGLKGVCEGGACVYEKQALVLINQGGASSIDILKLARRVVNEVYQRFGIKLAHEVRFMDAQKETDLDKVYP